MKHDDPLHLLASWQVIVITLAALALTQITKKLLDYFLASREGGLRAAVRTGADLRRQHPLISQVLMPALPIVFAVVLALTVPVHPEELEHWVALRKEPAWLSYTVWGVYCGVMADYLFSHGHDAQRAARNRAG
jgi:hypothetical protein